MSIYRVIDKLEAYIKDGTALPLKYRVLSEERLIEFIEKMRSTLPEEVGRAKLIARDKDRVLREAQEKAQSIVTEASTAHAALIDEHEIVRQAQRAAENVLREAEEGAGADSRGRRCLRYARAQRSRSSANNGAGLGEEGHGSAHQWATGARRRTGTERSGSTRRCRGEVETVGV